MARDEHKDLCEDLVKNYTVEYTAGGSAMNVMRVVAGIYRSQGIEGRSLFTGCIGHDKFAEVMKKKASDDGVLANFATSRETPTGTCAVCLSNQGKSRSLCAFLGASEKFTDQHLKDNWVELVEKTDIIYMSGFLIAVSPASYHLLGEHIAKNESDKKKFCLNLSAPYLSQVFGAELEKIIKYVDVIFGNDEEARAFAQLKKYDCKSLEEIARQIVLEPKTRSSIGRMVIITQGHENIIVVHQDSKASSNDNLTVRTFPVPSVEDNLIVDTNGAGDAFAGGFISQMALGESLEASIEMGIFAAQEIIKVSGINFPKSINLRPPSTCIKTN